MKPKSLIKTNPHLRDEAKRKMLVARSVRTSSGVEGIKSKPDKVLNITITQRTNKKIYKNR